MGRYIDWADVVGRYRTFSTNVDATEAEADYIPYAENYVDMGLASQFAVPFSSNNVTVKDLAIDAAMGKALMFKDDEKSAAIFTHVNDIMEKLRKGDFAMVTSGEVIARLGEPAYSKTMDYAPIFGHGYIEDFKVDSGMLYDEEVARDY